MKPKNLEKWCGWDELGGQEATSGRKRIIAAALIASLLLNAASAYVVLAPVVNGFYARETADSTQRAQALESQVQAYHDEVEKLSKQAEDLLKQEELLQQQVEYYRSQAEYYAGLSASKPASEGLKGSVAINLVAVRVVPSGFEAKYVGVTFQGVIELKPGGGRVLMDTEPRVGIDLQTSLRTAVQVTEKLASVELGATDIIVTVKSEKEVEVIDGPSAGGALTIALIAAVKNDKLNPHVYMTGTIKPDGAIGAVGGVAEKAIAAAEKEANVFIVPKGQSTVVVYVEEKKQLTPGFTIITSKPVKVSLENLLRQQGYNVKVVEAENVEQAYKLYTE